MKYSKYLLQQAKQGITPEDQEKILAAVRKVTFSRFIKDVKPEREFLATFGIEIFKAAYYLAVKKNNRVLKDYCRDFDTIGYLFKPCNTAKRPADPETAIQKAIWYFKHDKNWIFHDAEYYTRQIEEYRERIARDMQELEKYSRLGEREQISAAAEWKERKAEIINKVKAERGRE